MVVNLAYSLAAHIIYKPIDWVSVMSYVLMAGSVVMSFIMHWLGRWIYGKFKKQKMDGQIQEGLMSNQDKSQDHNQIDANKNGNNGGTK